MQNKNSRIYIVPENSNRISDDYADHIAELLGIEYGDDDKYGEFRTCYCCNWTYRKKTCEYDMNIGDQIWFECANCNYHFIYCECIYGVDIYDIPDDPIIICHECGEKLSDEEIIQLELKEITNGN